MPGVLVLGAVDTGPHTDFLIVFPDRGPQFVQRADEREPVSNLESIRSRGGCRRISSDHLHGRFPANWTPRSLDSSAIVFELLRQIDDFPALLYASGNPDRWNTNGIPGLYFIVRAHSAAVDPYLAASEYPVNAAFGYTFQMTRQKIVNALSGVFVGHIDFTYSGPVILR